MEPMKNRKSTSVTPAETTSNERLAPRRRPAQMRALQTVDLVLEAAASEIEREGLDKLTTKRIAAAAGLSVGALYEYFPNKQAVVHALVTQWLQRVAQAVDEVHPRHGGSRDVMTYLNDQFNLVAQMYEDRPGLGALIHTLDAVPELSQLTRDHDDLVTASVASALTHYAPHADALKVETAARCIGLLSHSFLCAALVYRTAPKDLMFANARACWLAIVAPLLMH
jgi:AcrR family transcriptional regulator